MFLSNRMVLPTPPSFVKLRARQPSVTTGRGISTPINDDVPELI
jgi:hypothetical protein